MKLNLTAREQNLILAAAALVFCALFIMYLIVPLWQSYNVVRTDLDNTTAGWNKLQAQKKAGAANQDIEKIENEVKLMRKQIPSAADTAELVFYLNQASGETGVSLDGFEVMMPENKNRNQDQEQTVKSLDAKVSISGTYVQIQNFVAQTESLTRLSHNKALTLTQSRTTPGNYQCTIEFRAFLAERNTTLDSDSDIPNQNLAAAVKSDIDTTITITDKMGSEAVGKVLEEKGVVKDRNQFLQLVNSRNAQRKIRTGTFTVPVGGDMEEILNILVGKKSLGR